MALTESDLSSRSIARQLEEGKSLEEIIQAEVMAVTSVSISQAEYDHLSNCEKLLTLVAHTLRDGRELSDKLKAQIMKTL